MAPIEHKDVEIKPDGLIYLPEIRYRRILNRAFGKYTIIKFSNLLLFYFNILWLIRHKGLEPGHCFPSAHPSWNAQTWSAHMHSTVTAGSYPNLLENSPTLRVLLLLPLLQVCSNSFFLSFSSSLSLSYWTLLQRPLNQMHWCVAARTWVLGKLVAVILLVINIKTDQNFGIPNLSLSGRKNMLLRCNVKTWSQKKIERDYGGGATGRPLSGHGRRSGMGEFFFPLPLFFFSFSFFFFLAPFFSMYGCLLLNRMLNINAHPKMPLETGVDPLGLQMAIEDASGNFFL